MRGLAVTSASLFLCICTPLFSFERRWKYLYKKPLAFQKANQ